MKIEAPTSTLGQSTKSADVVAKATLRFKFGLPAGIPLLYWVLAATNINTAKANGVEKFVASSEHQT